MCSLKNFSLRWNSNPDLLSSGGGDDHRAQDWDRCFDFQNIFGKQLAFKHKTLLNFPKNCIITLVFNKEAKFSPKIGEIRYKVIIALTPGPSIFVLLTFFVCARALAAQMLACSQLFGSERENDESLSPFHVQIFERGQIQQSYKCCENSCRARQR
jgi:hypothetical protein